MTGMTVNARRLVLRFAPSGQFSFRHFSADSSDCMLYTMATLLNEFQDCDVDKILKVHVYEF
jgi:hypothetical protein